MNSVDDHFGVPEENLTASKKWKDKKKKKHLFHIYVPTRKEVATLLLAELKPILVGWMRHSPTEIIPSRTQIDEVRIILLKRNDANELTELIEMCTRYINHS